MKIKKAVIPAAGLGTRVLPASKAIPKEMLPIVDKPAIQYIVEEAVAAGITDILIITGRGKGAIEDHFDRAPELEDKLLQNNKQELYDACMNAANLANIHYIRQKETKGLGHAVLCAKSFVGDEPFVVMYGDDVILGDIPATKELCDVFEETGRCVLGVKEVPLKDMSKYGSIKFHRDENERMIVTDMNEKPKPEDVLSPYAILGRVVLTPEIFDILENTEPGFGGEIQLTDAMRKLALDDKMAACEYSGTRYDMGNKLGIIEATLSVGLSREELKDDLAALIKKIAEKL
ncbi:MAG: UTP--glucose-1-phosphate uridylyltransferase GalU [Oscillospiraceae bacterium]|nr:UTP--glucose-1-phosphate uridylyltransferase GalU [Oscillospiraceae bacterium]